jgi:SSS family transporter
MPLQGHLQLPDHIMIAGYFVLMLAIGVYFYRHMRGMKAFFTGNNRIPWWLSGVSFYMSSFSVLAFVLYPSVAYRNGWVGVTLLWVAVPATIFSAFIFGKRWRRARIDSPMEYLETRYSPALRQVFAWQGLPVKIIDDGMKLFATGKFVSICSGLSIEYSILGVGAIILLYTFMGGLWAVMVTDFIQFIVLSVAIVIILPLAVAKADGFAAIIQNVPDNFFHLTSPEYGWSYVLPLVFLYCLAWSSIQWALIQRYYCVPKESDVYKVGGLVTALYVVGPPLMFFPAIAATRFIPNLADAGDVYPTLCATLLPAGILGLAIAAMFAATMSTLSGDYNVCASVVTNDIYRRLIRPHARQKELVFVGRIATIVIGIVALGTAFLLSRGKAESLFRYMVTLFGLATAPVAVPMLLGLVSKRFNSVSAMAGFLCGIAAGVGLFIVSRYSTEVSLGAFTWKPDSEEIILGTFAVKMEIVMFFGSALATLLAMIVASLFSRESAARLERVRKFLAQLDTPIGSHSDDQPVPAVAAGDFSPFRVIGACLIGIGIIMVAITPWILKSGSNGSVALAMNAGLALLMILLGAVMAWPRKTRAIAHNAGQPAKSQSL